MYQPGIGAAGRRPGTGHRLCRWGVVAVVALSIVLPYGNDAPGISSAAGPRTGGISYPLSYVRSVQRAVDRGDSAFQYFLNPVSVTRRVLPGFGYSRGPITVISPAPPRPAPTAHLGEDGLPETDVVIRYGGRQYWVVLNQFVRHGRGGAWFVITIAPM